MVNSIFLHPGAFLIEVVPANALDSRHMPVSGIFSRLAAVFALHHYTFLYDINHPTFPSELMLVVKKFVNDVFRVSAR